MNIEEDLIIPEVEYCLNCTNKPCMQKGCPLGNNIPEVIQLVKEENYKEAYKVLSKTTVLPGICGKICPHSRQCQKSCIRGIKGNPVKIGKIESFVFQKAIENNYRLIDIWEKDMDNKLSNIKVAIIGGGPAGLTCAAYLVKQGVKVTIYEKNSELGGILVHGIPDFRLDKNIIKETIDRILELGIEVKYNAKINKVRLLNEIEKQYDAIFLSVGSNKSIKSNIEGEDLIGVFGANELLEYSIHPNYTGKKVAIIGGGNVAMDCCRTIKRLRSKRSLYYI